MTTLTTKQLREQMPEVIRKLRQGESVQLTYRRKVIGTLQPEQTPGKPLRRGSPEAILDFLKHADFGPIPDKLRNDPRSFKEQIAELRDQDLRDQ